MLLFINIVRLLWVNLIHNHEDIEASDMGSFGRPKDTRRAEPERVDISFIMEERTVLDHLVGEAAIR